MHVILASQSPRRRFLIEKMGLNAEVLTSHFEEYFDETRSPQEVAAELALEKAKVIAEQYPDAIVIGGDTIVAYRDKQIGKTESKEEAREILRGYSGGTCEVISGVAVVCSSRGVETSGYGQATVRFKELDDEQINTYLASGDFVDKGGSFSVQHPLVQPMLERIDGRLDAIIGLPTDVLAHMLSQLGVQSQPVSDADIDLAFVSAIA